MANHDWESDGWVDERLATLRRGPEWIPDAGRALARLQARRSENRRGRVLAARRWLWTTLAAAGAGVALLLLPASRACAQQPGACVQRVLRVVAPAGSAPVSEATNPATPAHSTEPRRVAPSATVNQATLPFETNFKEAGSRSAPVSVEIYIDYECVHCESFVRDVAPLLMEQYVATGKVRLLYRDFPLPSHRYARLAARYADAAGALGYYDAVMKQLFATRPVWSASGDIDSEVAGVLPAEVMGQVRSGMHCDPDPDSLWADVAAGQADHPDRTPFVVIVSGGKREAVTDAPLTFEVLKSALDRLADQ